MSLSGLFGALKRVHPNFKTLRPRGQVRPRKGRALGRRLIASFHETSTTKYEYISQYQRFHIQTTTLLKMEQNLAFTPCSRSITSPS